MAQYMLMLYDDPASFSDLTPEDMQRVIGEYRAWSERLGAAGKLVGGQKLKDEGGRLMSCDGGEVTVTDGPYTETKEVLGGFFIVEAASYDEAVELARGCPHAKYGPRIDVRAVDDAGSSA